MSVVSLRPIVITTTTASSAATTSATSSTPAPTEMTTAGKPDQRQRTGDVIETWSVCLSLLITHWLFYSSMKMGRSWLWCCLTGSHSLLYDDDEIATIKALILFHLILLLHPRHPHFPTTTTCLFQSARPYLNPPLPTHPYRKRRSANGKSSNESSKTTTRKSKKLNANW